MILNSIFKDTVVVREDTEFVNCEFSGGATPQQKGVYGVGVEGNASIKLSGCKFANKGYSAVYMNTSGSVDITGCDFDCTGLYNPIEGASGINGAPLTKVKVEDSVMRGICGNNYINVYHFADNAVVDINNVKVVGTRKDIVAMAKKYRVEEIVFAIPTASLLQRKQILAQPLICL